MLTKKHTLSLVDTGQFPKILLDYVDQNPSIKELYNYAPNIQAFKKAIEDRKNMPLNRNILTDALKKQYQKSSIESPIAIELLNKEQTFTVCTGHQLCLFTGPLYFIYKILSTINLTESLQKEYPTYNFIPVYWMASEDHDFDEIKSTHLFGKTITWENDEAKGAVGDLNTSTLSTTLAQYAEVLGSSDSAQVLIDLFNQAYTTQNNLADATRYFVHQLFASYNLLVIDGNDSMLKASFSAMIADDLFENNNHRLVDKSIETLQKIGYKAQVTPRKINCFYLKDGRRERIEQSADDGLFKVLTTSIEFTERALKEELKNHPERFSPNVVLRPLYQQFILPNLAYVGGPGEIAYWLEFKTMFDFHKVQYPVLIPRNFALLVDEKQSQQFQKFGFTLPDVFKDLEILIKEYVNKVVDVNLELETEAGEIVATFNNINKIATKVDVTLKAAVEAELQKALKSLKMLEAKMMRAEKQKQETSILQLKKIKDKLFPEGILQERYENMAPYYLKHGTDFIKQLKEQFDPFDFKLLILEN